MNQNFEDDELRKRKKGRVIEDNFNIKKSNNKVIFRMQKLKSRRAITGSLKHMYREQETFNADDERKNLNENIISNSVDESNKLYNERLGEHKARKDAVHGVEFLYTASPGFFQNCTKEQEEEFFKIGKKFIADQIGGEQNIIACTIHRDETSPHLSIIAIPMKDNKLNAKYYVGGNKSRLSDTQTEIAEKVEHLGLERGKKKSKAQHVDIKSYYSDVVNTKEYAKNFINNARNQAKKESKMLEFPSKKNERLENKLINNAMPLIKELEQSKDKILKQDEKIHNLEYEKSLYKKRWEDEKKQHLAHKSQFANFNTNDFIELNKTIEKADNRARQEQATEEQRARVLAEQKAIEEQAKAQALAEQKAIEEQAKAQALVEQKAIEEQAKAQALVEQKAREEQAKAQALVEQKAIEEKEKIFSENANNYYFDILNYTKGNQWRHPYSFIQSMARDFNLKWEHVDNINKIEKQGNNFKLPHSNKYRNLEEFHQDFLKEIIKEIGIENVNNYVNKKISKKPKVQSKSYGRSR